MYHSADSSKIDAVESVFQHLTLISNALLLLFCDKHRSTRLSVISIGEQEEFSELVMRLLHASEK